MNWSKIDSGLRYMFDISPGLAHMTLLSSKSSNTSPLKTTKKETSHSSSMGRIVWNGANVNQSGHNHLISRGKCSKDCNTHPRLVFKAMTHCFGEPAVSTVAGTPVHPPGRTRRQQTAFVPHLPKPRYHPLRQIQHGDSNLPTHFCLASKRRGLQGSC